MLASHGAHSSADVEGLVICLLVVALVAVFVYFAGRLAGRPDIGGIGAAIVAVVGGLLCLL